jgi:uncharacterized protein (DUF362 family)
MEPGPQVAIGRTIEKHRSFEHALSLLRETMGHLGGMSKFVKPGDRVLIKPNQTVFYPAEEGCTTDPYVIGAIIQLARECEASRIQVAESSGGFFSSLSCMRITGTRAVAERFGAELIDLGSDSVPNRIVKIPDGTVAKEAPIPEPLLDATVIIDAAKAKNHHIEPITGALKNWVGSVNQEWREHHHGDDDMIGRFVDIMSVTKPKLCITDALIIGEGDGPIANLPRWMGCILASSDPVAMDVSIAKLLGHDWRRLKFAEHAETRGLGRREPVEYFGIPMDEVAIKAWPPHEGFDYLPLNFLVGEGVTLAGTIGHVKSVLDSMLRRGDLNHVNWYRGTPTIMIGRVHDPEFEKHIKEGPYVVFDDSAHDKYKKHPKVHFVKGHPVLRTAMPELMRGLEVNCLGMAVMKLQQFQYWFIHNIQYGTAFRRGITLCLLSLLLMSLLAVAAGLGALVIYFPWMAVFYVLVCSLLPIYLVRHQLRRAN